MSAPLALRPYQQDNLQAIYAAEKRGVRRQLSALPTGAGKTVIFVHLIAQRQQRTLILVHRDELIKQTQDKLTMLGVTKPIGIVKGIENQHAGDIVVASVQTLSRLDRLAQVDATFKLLVVDEAHHALPGNSYGDILTYMGAFHEDGPLTCGFTATPFRPNNTPLITTGGVQGCFDAIVYALPLPWMIEHGYLVPIEGHRIYVKGLDLDRVRISHGDYSADAVSQAMIAANAPEHLVRGYHELTPDRRALVFCPTALMTHKVEKAMRDSGIAAASVLGTTPIDERQEIYRQVRAGKVRALVNCMVLTEGFDEPSIDAIFMARPTRSKVLYTQCIGRGLRLWQDKDDCLVIDAVGATKRHDLFSVAALLGLLTHKPPGEAPDLPPPGPTAVNHGTDYAARQLDLLDRDPLHWVTTKKGYWVMSLLHQMLRIRSDGGGLYRLEAKAQGAKGYTVIANQLTQEYCLGIAAHTAADAKLEFFAREGAHWRSKPRSAAQEAFARKRGIVMKPGWKAGDLSDAITAHVGDWYD